MFGSGIRRREKQEDEIDRSAVDRLVVDGFAQPREQPVYLRKTFDLRMRNGDPLAKARRAQLLALVEARQHRRRVDAKPLAGEFRQLLHERTLVAAGEGGLDRVAIEKIGKMHK